MVYSESRDVKSPPSRGVGSWVFGFGVLTVLLLLSIF